jgi:hypothetical protein
MQVRGSLPTPEESQSTEGRFDLARGALKATGTNKDGDWQMHVLNQLVSLTGWVAKGYAAARRKQSTQAWESRVAPVATGGTAAVGAVIAVVGTANTSGTLRWILVAFGVLFAGAGSLLGANAYIRNRSITLRYLRLLHDIPDYAYLVLPTARPADAYSQLDTFRQLWETAGT